MGAEDPVEADGARRAQNGCDGPVRQRALDGEGLLARGQHNPALEDAAQPLDVLGRPVGEVEQRALPHGLAVPIALAQQDGGRGAAVGDGLDVHGRKIADTPPQINKNIRFTWLHFLPLLGPKDAQNQRLDPRERKKLRLELLRAVEPMAIEAALEAERRRMESQAEQRRILELDLQQARYEASLAEQRYAACDPDNRLIAAQLRRAGRRRYAAWRRARPIGGANVRPGPRIARLAGLADDVDAAWNAPKRHHARPSAPAPRPCRRHHRRRRRGGAGGHPDDPLARRSAFATAGAQAEVRRARLSHPEALAAMRSMATRWSDEDVAASLNRMGTPTGQGKTWTAHRVGSLRRVHGIHASRSAEKDGEWLTMSEAAAALGVSHHRIRRLIQDGILSTDQVVPDAPHQIRASDLQDERVTAAIARTGRPCRVDQENQLPMFPDT